MMISGHTQLCFLLADPVEHVRTPQMFNAYLQAHAIDAVVVPLHVRRDDLRCIVASLRVVRNLRAIIVTIPHKIAIVDLCDALHESAQGVGAVNIVRRGADGRLTGANFDGSGFVTALQNQTGALAGRSVFMAGAGGVARAIGFEVARAGAARMTLANRSPAKGEALSRAIADAFPGIATSCATAPPRDCDIAINATSLGLHSDDALPFAIDALPRHAAVAEVVMQPLMTRLLREARERGLRIVTGDGMLDAQLPFWTHFLGLAPDAAPNEVPRGTATVEH